jgi:hypothetical protein
VSLTSINGRQKRHNLADTQEHSRSKAAVLKHHILAESAKIGQNLAGNPSGVIGFGGGRLKFVAYMGKIQRDILQK